MNKYSKIIVVFLSLLLACWLCVGCSSDYSDDFSGTTDSYDVTSDDYDSSIDSDSVSSAKCAATPCPNNAIAGSSFCEVHESGKINNCLECGKPIWADETYCDKCLFGTDLSDDYDSTDTTSTDTYYNPDTGDTYTDTDGDGELTFDEFLQQEDPQLYNDIEESWE